VTTADLLKAARDVLPPASGARPIATVEQTRGHALPDGSPAGVGGQTVYRPPGSWTAAGGRSRSARRSTGRVTSGGFSTC
jgi:hypothetical protein